MVTEHGEQRSLLSLSPARYRRLLVATRDPYELTFSVSGEM